MTPSEDFKNLILRSSRSLGAMLVKLDFVNEAQLGKANQNLLEALEKNKLDESCLLSFLIFNENAFNENDLIESLNYPLIDLRSFEISHPSTIDIDINLCHATFTFPFDKEEGYIFVASLFVLSDIVIEEWEKLAPGKIIWHATSIESMKYAFDQLKLDENAVPKIQ